MLVRQLVYLLNLVKLPISLTYVAMETIYVKMKPNFMCLCSICKCYIDITNGLSLFLLHPHHFWDDI